MTLHEKWGGHHHFHPMFVIGSDLKISTPSDIAGQILVTSAEVTRNGGFSKVIRP